MTIDDCKEMKLENKKLKSENKDLLKLLSKYRKVVLMGEYEDYGAYNWERNE